MTTSTASQPKLYIGLDINKRSWKINVTTDSHLGIPVDDFNEGILQILEKRFKEYP